MKKISTLFVINYPENKGKGTITEEIRPENIWVFEDSENVVATQKFDGTATLILNGELYKRYDAKPGKQAPEGSIPCQEADPITGHHPHWVKVSKDNKADKYFLECDLTGLEDGTYEMCGEKVGTNPEHITGHKLLKHGSVILNIPDVSFIGLKEYLTNVNDIEGIVFHHKDGRMCKLRKSDFNVKR